uniref:bifunctional arginine demethylase and lysyl-hydroxylase JMJD6-like n=1 Tax=Ciona intestinalis TaxID=7719 RepID=UPI0002B8E9A6|nr:bifunctional arginine demethylase and lysyl-hydroxylase JMJD6-like [Ciona intestinalis]|eukprot:XP_026689582.1 bifunctional arginine demethylase and lysyl-hydroxylase JMJD6-like [Ciona intestinalis]
MATVDQFKTLLKHAEDLGISWEQLNRLNSVKAIQNDGKKWLQRNPMVLYAGLVFLFSISLPLMYLDHELGTLEDSEPNPLNNWKCFLSSQAIGSLVRPPLDCNACKDVTEIFYLKNITQEEFTEKYAHSMQTVVVQDGQKGWTASKTFSYEYFKSIYPQGSKALMKIVDGCQFFNFETDLAGPADFFNMSQSRVEGKEDQWYVGWSNCEGHTANELRRHYKLPYFLSPELDHGKKDWIYMGLPGPGAPMHIDRVPGATWQAQLSGEKEWTFEAPPECYGICTSKMKVRVKAGEIIVLDGSRWYHETNIIGKDMSIVIGSEFY